MWCWRRRAAIEGAQHYPSCGAGGGSLVSLTSSIARGGQRLQLPSSSSVRCYFSQSTFALSKVYNTDSNPAITDSDDRFSITLEDEGEFELALGDSASSKPPAGKHDFKAPFPHFQPNMSMAANHHVGASVVASDPVALAKLRDQHARDLLQDNLPEQKAMFTLADVAMTVPYTLKIVCGAAQTENSKKIAQEVLAEAMRDCNTILNNFNPESEVSRLNNTDTPTNTPIPVSATLWNVLVCVTDVARSSGGGFDPASAPIAAYLRNIETSCTQPVLDEDGVDRKAESIIAYSSMLSSWEIVKPKKDGEPGCVIKKHSEARLDLGGVSKGATVDAVVEGLVARDLVDVLFDWGGDCRAHGLNSQGRRWCVGVIRPPTVDEIFAAWKEGRQVSARSNPEPKYIRVMELDNDALATSGDYENLLIRPCDDTPTGAPPRNWSAATTIYDVDTKQLLRTSYENFSQVSVRNASCMYADALATAGLVKKAPIRLRHFLEGWRYQRNAVKDYTSYQRGGEVVACMHKAADVTPESHKDRIAATLPAKVVVVGGGLAGLSAALEAAQFGATVIVLEKSNRVGGNSAKATSGINGWGTEAQALKGVMDAGKFFERDTHLSGVKGTTEPSLVKTLSSKSGEAIRWLSKTHGVPLSVLSQLGGHSHPRTHRAPDQKDGTPMPIGYTIMRHLEKSCRANPRITILTSVQVKSLIRSEKTEVDGVVRVEVHGVRYSESNATPGTFSGCEEGGESCERELICDAVVLATGGFSNDHNGDNSLIKKYAPHLLGVATTNGPFATGDGVKMANEAGALLVDMDKLQLHPTGFIDPKDPGNATKFLGPEALRGSGGILLNTHGRRFINELDLRSVVSKGIIDQQDVYPNSNGAKFAFCILNEAAVKLFGPAALGFYMNKQGLVTKVADIDALAQHIFGVATACSAHSGKEAPSVSSLVDSLQSTLAEYRKVSEVKGAICPKTAKRVFPCVIDTEGPFYVSLVTPSIHYTMGGAAINAAGEILSDHQSSGIFGSRRPIQRLFGAGEVTGGVHGNNRLGGNSLLECVVFGRTAGDRAATILQRHNSGISFDEWSTVQVREIREGDVYGHGSKVLRFNLPGSLQSSGLTLGQFVGIRSEWDGRQLIGYYSPITLPNDYGVIGILARVDKGVLKDWINSLAPGDHVEIRGFGGLQILRMPSKGCFVFNSQPIRKIAMIAGGTGIAPMLQIIRAALKQPYCDAGGIDSLNLIYAAEEYDELTYRNILLKYEEDHSSTFKLHFVVNNPPPGWIGGVGFVSEQVLSKHIQRPSPDLLVVICGPPVMQRVVKSILQAQGYNMDQVRTVDETGGPSAKL